MTTSRRIEPGAPPADGFIPLSVPCIRGNEWKYVKECLDTNWVSSVGSFVDRFERQIAERVGTAFAVATVNGTAALHLSLLVAGVRPEDEVLVPTLTFVAPSNAVRYVGAWPVFVDAEQNFFQMDVAQVRSFLENQCQRRDGILCNRITGRRVSAMLPVHVLGHPVDMDPILALAREHGLAVVEDATEGLGAGYRGRNLGSLGDIGCLSFNGNKIITTGGGGMIVTDNEAWARKARYLSTQAKDDPVEFVHQEIGYNYRLTNVLAAIGCAQLELLDEFVEAKLRIAARYAQAFRGNPSILGHKQAGWARSTFWQYTVLVSGRAGRRGSRPLLKALEQRRIQTRPLWRPNHQLAPHQGCQYLGGTVAERLHAHALNLPNSVSLSDEEQDYVIAAVLEAVAELDSRA